MDMECIGYETITLETSCQITKIGQLVRLLSQAGCDMWEVDRAIITGECSDEQHRKVVAWVDGETIKIVFENVVWDWDLAMRVRSVTKTYGLPYRFYSDVWEHTECAEREPEAVDIRLIRVAREFCEENFI